MTEGPRGYSNDVSYLRTFSVMKSKGGRSEARGAGVRSAALAEALLSLLLLSACVSPPPPPVPLSLPPASGAVTASDLVSVTVVAAPERLVVDGDLAEWGGLLPPSAPDGDASQIAASHVAIAVTGDGARIAADLGEEEREGIWLGIGSELPLVLPVGEYTQVGGSLGEPVMGIAPPPECRASKGEDAGADPEAHPDCKAFRREHAAFEAAYQRRFLRYYRIDREGVRMTKDDGTVAAVDGAKVVFKRGTKRATLEASLPALALPRLHDAPLRTLQVVARAARTATPPDISASRWPTQPLPAPVGFEPLAELRARAFGASKWMSYQPGDPAHIETLRYPSTSDQRSVVVREEPLYVKVATLGDAEIGYLTIARDPDPGRASDRVMLAILAKDTASVVPIEGAPMVVAVRDGQLHVLSYDQWGDDGVFVLGTVSSFGHATCSVWSAILVGPDGKHRERRLDDLMVPWDSVSELHDQDSFGMRGLPASWAIEGEKPGQHAEFRWRWDPRKDAYVGQRRNLPAP